MQASVKFTKPEQQDVLDKFIYLCLIKWVAIIS